MPARLTRAAPAVSLAVLALAGCASTAGSPAGTGSPGVPAGGGSASTPPITAPTTGPPSSGAGTVTLSDRDDGRTVTVHVGQRVRVVLDSTYWTISDPSDPAVLAAASVPSTSPSPGCVAGEGCGTVTRDFVARSAGTAVVSASRISCGEAMHCSGRAGRFRVTVVVS